MTAADALRALVAGLCALISGAVAVVFVTYLRAALRRPRHGRLRLRHVAEISAGTFLLVTALGYGVYESVGAATGPPMSRLLQYLAALLLVLVALLDIGNHIRTSTEGEHS